jgi:hypothetical protein
MPGGRDPAPLDRPLCPASGISGAVAVRLQRGAFCSACHFRRRCHFGTCHACFSSTFCERSAISTRNAGNAGPRARRGSGHGGNRRGDCGARACSGRWPAQSRADWRCRRPTVAAATAKPAPGAGPTAPGDMAACPAGGPSARPAILAADRLLLLSLRRPGPGARPLNSVDRYAAPVPPNDPPSGGNPDEGRPALARSRSSLELHSTPPFWRGPGLASAVRGARTFLDSYIT